MSVCKKVIQGGQFQATYVAHECPSKSNQLPGLFCHLQSLIARVASNTDERSWEPDLAYEFVRLASSHLSELVIWPPRAHRGTYLAWLCYTIGTAGDTRFYNMEVCEVRMI